MTGEQHAPRRAAITRAATIAASFALACLACWLAVGYAMRQVYEEGRRQTDDQFFNLIHGPAVMIEQRLHAAPPAEWPRILAELRPDFDFDLNVRPLSDIKFMPDERLRVMRGEIARGDEDQVDTAHYRIRGTDLAIAMGPIWITPVSTDYWSFISVRLLCTVTLMGLLLSWPIATWRLLAPARRDRDELAAFLQELAVEGRTERTLDLRSRSLRPLAAQARRVAAAMRELADHQRELSHAVSHEMRTPVARLRFGLALLDDSARPGNERVLDSLARSLQDLDDLVECSLTYARYTQARPALALSRLDVGAWVRDETRQIAGGGEDAVPVGVSTHVDGPAEADFDPSHLKFALRNLVTNALKHARTRVAVGVRREDGEIHVDVDDDGEGVPPADRARILTPFVRGRRPPRRAEEGHGLGLSIAARIVAWHGGRIEVREAPIGGARFSLVWPISAG